MSYFKRAEKIVIADDANVYTSTNVEDALEEVKLIADGAGGGTLEVVNISSNTNLSQTEGTVLVRANTTSGQVTAKLPIAAGNTAIFHFKKISNDANNAIISGFNLTNDIDSLPAQTIIVSGSSLTLVPRTGGWDIV
jgi:hypothetical protein